MRGRAVVYTRVSGTKQLDGASLDTQKATCLEWCDKQSIEVMDVFIERAESAKSADRPEFQRMFAYLAKAKKGLITHLVVYKTDRFARNTTDAAAYRKKLEDLGVKLRSATEPVDDTAAGQLMGVVLDGFAQFDNRQRAERAKTGMRARAEQGRWVVSPPTGYLQGSKKGASLVHDPERALLVRRFFELFASGEYNKTQALDAATSLGLKARSGGKIDLQTAIRMLKNPVYVGRVRYENWGIERQGDFEGIVSQELFDKVQLVLGGKSPVSVPHHRDSDDWPLRGLLLCKECGLPVSGSASSGKRNKYPYYHCHREKGHVRTPKEVAESSFINLLDMLVPSTERWRLVKAAIREQWAARGSLMEQDAKALQTELSKLETKRKRLVDALTDGCLKRDDYKTAQNELDLRASEIRVKLRQLKVEGPSVEDALDFIEHLLWNTRYEWQMADLEGKQKIQRRLFPYGVILHKEGVGTPATNSIYTVLGDENVGVEEMVRPE